MLNGSVKNASLFSKIYLGSDRFWRVWFSWTDKVSFKSSCFLDWNVMFTKVASIDKIKLIFMALVFVFFLSSVVFCKLSSKIVWNLSLEKCHDKPLLEWNLISVKLWKIKRSDQTDCCFSIGTWMSYNTQETSEIRVTSKIDRTALTETLS